MLTVNYDQNSNVVTLGGKLDSSNVEEAKSVFETIQDSVTIDMDNLEFISSTGIGILVMTYRRLTEKNKEMNLTNLSEHIKKVFEVSLLDKVFNII